MPWFHLIFGLLLFIGFTITGTFMRFDFPDKELIPQELRLLMRSRHIYILFSALIHISLGLYLRIRPRMWERVLQYGGSAALVFSSLLLVWAWYIETYELGHFTDISRDGIYASLAGIGLHLIGGFSQNRER
jgi:hypothetical protein